MHNWSLVGFTLLVQASIGLTWLSVLGAWIAGVRTPGALLWPLSIALVLNGVGIIAATAHLSKPRLALHALRNLKLSWLSREIVLVQAFAGTQVALILSAFWGGQSLLWAGEALACLTGGLALCAMTRVYLIRTVPIWNTMATALEFVGSSLLLGGGFTALFTSLAAPVLATGGYSLPAAGMSIGLGLLLKLAAISPSLQAQAAARSQIRYAVEPAALSTGQLIATRTLLNLMGLSLILLLFTRGSEPAWLWACLSLACLTAGEVWGRWRFYAVYERVGL